MLTLWNYRKLAHALNENAIPRKEYQWYILLFLLINGVNLLFSATQGREMSGQEIFFYRALPWLVFAVYLGGAYLINRKGDGQAFLKRFICLDVVVTIRTLVFAMLFIFLAALIMQLLGQSTLPAGITDEEKAAHFTRMYLDPLTMFTVIFSMIYGCAILFIGFSIASRQSLPRVG